MISRRAGMAGLVFCPLARRPIDGFPIMIMKNRPDEHERADRNGKPGNLAPNYLLQTFVNLLP
jgi:hypothetical protein